MTQENQPLKVDLNDTLYDYLGLPEGDENIALYVRYIAVALNQEIDSELAKINEKEHPMIANKLKALRDTHLPRLIEEIDKAKKTGDISLMLSKYSLIDTARTRDDLKELERNNSLSNRNLNDIINDRMKIWTRMFKNEERAKYDAALFEKRKAYVERITIGSSKKSLYKFLRIPELPSELAKSIEGIISSLKFIEARDVNDPEFIDMFQRKSDGLNKKSEIYDENRVNPLIAVKKVAPILIERLEEIMADYTRSGNADELLKGYSGVNIVLKKLLLDNEVANGELTQDSASKLMKEYNHAWVIITNPELKKIYDLKLDKVKRREAIKEELKRNREHRKDLVEEEIMRNGDISSFDMSRVDGAKYQYGRLDGLPVYMWSVKEYPEGKKLIMSTNSKFKDNPELDEKVEVYAHGEFCWGSMYRITEDGKLSPTIIDETCEVISVRKVDKDGNETVTYGIAQTRDLGYWDNLTRKQIDELRKRYIPVVVSDEFRDRNRNKSIYDINSRKSRKRPEIYEITRVRKPTAFGDKLIKLNRIIDKIGLEIPDYMIPTKIIEKRVPIKTTREDFSDTASVFARDPNRRYKAFVFDPVRYKISPTAQEDIARIMLSDFVLDKFKEGNGHFIGALADNKDLSRRMSVEDTVGACQYASKYPGTLVRSDGSKKKIQSLNDVFEHFKSREKNRKTQLEKPSTKRFSDSIDFYGE